MGWKWETLEDQMPYGQPPKKAPEDAAVMLLGVRQANGWKKETRCSQRGKGGLTGDKETQGSWEGQGVRNPSVAQLICDGALGRELGRDSLSLGLAKTVPFHRRMGKSEERGKWVGGCSPQKA